MDAKRCEYRDDITEAEDNLRSALVALARARKCKNVTPRMRELATLIARETWQMNELIESIGGPFEYSPCPTPPSSPLYNPFFK